MTAPAFWRFLPEESVPDAARLRAGGGALARALREARDRLGAGRAGAMLRAAEQEAGRRFGRRTAMLVASPFQVRALADPLQVAFAIAGLALDLRPVEGLAALSDAMAEEVSPGLDGVDLAFLPLADMAALPPNLAEDIARRILAPVLVCAFAARTERRDEGGVARHALALTDPLDLRFGASFGALPTAAAADALADEAAAFAARLKGTAPKLLVTDLDGTLWAETLGEAPQLTLHGAYAEALAALRGRGLVLGLASRNEDRDVIAAFDARPDWPLPLAAFAARAVGWADKADLVGQVLAATGLAAEHAVVVDDDPVNCAALAARFPDMDVRRFCGPPEAFARMLLADPLLLGGGKERAGQYGLRAAVETLRTETPDMDAFLRRLGTRLTVVPLSPETARRAAELASRVNQFVLTDMRPNAVAMEARASGFDVLVRLDDAFGPHGLVGLVLAREEGDAVRIDNLFLSCRALQRGVEQAMLAALAVRARAAGFRVLSGRVETLPRNAPARALFSRAGFIESDGEWVYPLATTLGCPEAITLEWARS